ncbi:MAG: D-tyrosyl-tRNA(Tyr) deacylase [Ignavibacteria bacterium]|nr:D-tyrosyl-tRNA(Tyr) deacylase [Ignavibacteria bacterium]
MKAVVQRVSKASVIVEKENYSAQIEKGLLILLGIKIGDTENDVNYVADKCTNLRIFQDENDKMNISVKDITGEVMIISQFTIYGHTAKGNRPSFTDAAKPDEAIPLYESFIKRMKQILGEQNVKTGIFGAMMDIDLVNYGPVTVIIDSD